MIPLLLKTDWSFLQYKAGGNTVSAYIWFGALVAAAFLLAKPLTAGVARIVSALVGRLSESENGALLRSMITRPLGQLLQCLLLYAAVNQLGKPFDMVLIHRSYKKDAMSIRLIDVVDHIFLFFLILIATLLLSRILGFIIRIRTAKAQTEGNADKLQILQLLHDVMRLLLWAIFFFTLMGTVFHVNVPALITGLGIGGVAIALAGKETVENLFASFTILADKPFRTGDAVKLGNIEGTAEQVGFRSTRLRSADGSMFIVPNKKLIDDNLENLTRRKVRRIRMPLMIKYGLSPGSLQSITREIEQMLSKHATIRKPIDVSFENFGENTLQLMVSYYLPHPLKAETLSGIKQEVSLKIFEILSRYVTPPPGAIPPPVNINNPPAQQPDQNTDTVNP